MNEVQLLAALIRAARDRMRKRKFCYSMEIDFFIAEFLLENGVRLDPDQKSREQNKWIPVTERLPKLENSPCDVLVLHELKGDLLIDVAWYSHDKRRWCSCSGMNLKVSHWMPLPELPKEGA